MPFAKDNPEGQARIAAFLQELQRLGWTVGRNLQSEYRWDTSDLRKARNGISDIVSGCHPCQHHYSCDRIATGDPYRADRICAGCRSRKRWPCCESREAWRQHHRVHEYRIRHRREMARTAQRNCSPRGTCRGHSDPTNTASIGQFAAIQSAARSFGVEVAPLGGRNAKDIEHTVTEFARGSNCGLISVATPLKLTIAV